MAAACTALADAATRMPDMGRAETTFLLTLLVAMGAVAISIFAPSLPDLVVEFESDPPTVKLTLTLFLAAFAVTQLFYGPLSDAFGRRPALLWGMGIFTVASAACALAPTIEWLIAGRAFQALGACCAPVVGRTLVRDMFGAAAAPMMATIAAALAIVPAISPALGGALHEVFGWRSVFYLLTLFGAAMVGWVAWRLPETNPPGIRDTSGFAALRPVPILRAYLGLLRNPLFLRPAAAVSFTYGAMFAYLTGAPFLLITELGLSPFGFGLVTMVNVTGYLVGTLSSRRYAMRFGTRRLILVGGTIGSVATVSFLALALSHQISLLPVVGLLWVNQIAIGLVLPNGSAGAVTAQPNAAGSASALLGFMQVAVAALVSLAVALFNDASQIPMVLLMAISMLGTAAVAGWRSRRG